MNTMTMANALKAVFGAQTLTTASYFPACAQDGTPSGVISAANLASVLGGVKKGGTVSNIDANDITTTSAYSINDVNYSTHNLPSQWGILVTIRASEISYVCIQLWKTASGSGFHVRLLTDSGSSAFWSEWARLDNA